MNQCPNCNTAISCSCQIRTATDGKQVCSNCISSYEDKIAQQAKTLNDLNNIQLKKFTS